MLKWWAPEVLLWGQFTPAADVYSLAVMFWEVLVGEEPYGQLDGRHAASQVVLQGQRPAITDEMWERAPELMQTLESNWSLRVADRYTSQKVRHAAVTPGCQPAAAAAAYDDAAACRVAGHARGRRADCRVVLCVWGADGRGDEHVARVPE